VISGGRRAFHATGMITDVSLRPPYLVFDRNLSSPMRQLITRL
jgi:hypothetical protein